MDAQARADYMTQTLTPVMKALFVEFDGARLADFGCPSCHGDNADEVGFAMPNGLAPLSASEVAASREGTQPVARFMSDRVAPTLRQLLGERAGDTPQACFRCHAVQVE